MNEHLMLQYPNKKIVQSTMKLSLSSCKFQIQMVEMIQELSKMQVKQFVLENTLFDFREKLNDLLETVLVQSELKGLLLNF
jgi:hypothetical protein